MGFNRYGGPLDQTTRFFKRRGAPVTMTIIVISVVLYLLSFFARALPLSDLLICVLPGHPLFWTLLTYPLVNSGYIAIVFYTFWLYSMGPQLENMWGARNYLFFWLVVTIGEALAVWLGSSLLHQPYVLEGLSLPLIALTVAWAAIDPYQENLLYFVIKIQARWVALFFVGLVYFTDFRQHPLLGLFGLTCCAIGYLWVRGLPYSVRASLPKLSGGRRGAPQRPTPNLRMSSLDDLREDRRTNRGPLGIYKEWQERKRLEKLFKGSDSFKDPDDRKRN